ncbi:MAG TPA: nucleoside phosphorylase [Flavobacteriales bacterium]|nr:nucleoside phosphorylase [Flavobacteriales bacterium]HMW96471.1 nucleoside phosphorylase [Flavobacteriales bacterium]HNE80766.1 nucleoside phosphorylase [Flavobacteriales bacterium]HNI05662.1 nucleoside phosphorylase [Flavobacteriales bacterium]HNK84746.1 nucleoside phosphorylase [Flavobacteriales bacterium]
MRPITLTEPGTVLPESELILNPDGSVYHLALKAEQLGDLVLVVGDPGRVKRISERFDQIEHQGQNREFIAHTGILRGRRITALATGIGTDNIDIVLGELDALANIDLAARTPKKDPRALTIVRLGTCGALQEDIPVDQFIVSHSAIGLDNVLHYYAHENTDAELRLLQAMLDHTDWPGNLPLPYIAFGDQPLVERLGHGNHTGITMTSGGFYGPQGRQLRAVPSVDGLNDAFSSFRFPGPVDDQPLRITNYEMETSALYGLGGLLGHRTATICAVVANRLRKEYSKDHHAAIGRMIDQVLERLVS